MKKKLSVMAVIILVLAICVSAWFYGYYNRKSNDNLPTLTAIAEMSEADVNSLLPGYHIDQLSRDLRSMGCGVKRNRIVHRRYLQIFANKKDPNRVS